MIDGCPLFTKSRPIDVFCRLLIPYYFRFHFLTWFKISILYDYIWCGIEEGM